MPFSIHLHGVRTVAPQQQLGFLSRATAAGLLMGMGLTDPTFIFGMCVCVCLIRLSQKT